MKTRDILVTAAAAVCLTSCETYFRTCSVVNGDGSLSREVYAGADSATVAAGGYDRVFPFALDGWSVQPLDTAVTFVTGDGTRAFTVKAARTFGKVDGEVYAPGSNALWEQCRPVMVPAERVEKKFRWFYTIYEYTAVFDYADRPDIVSPDKYMTREEQLMWFRSEGLAPCGQNGMEMRVQLDDLNDKMWKWFNEVSAVYALEVLAALDSVSGGGEYAGRLAQLRDSIVPVVLRYKPDAEIVTVEEVVPVLDRYYSTDHFSALYAANSKLIEEKYSAGPDGVFDKALIKQEFRVSMPGQICGGNAPVVDGNTAVWRMDLYRLVNGSYTMQVVSRVPHYWAYVLTIAVIAVLAVLCLRRRR